MALRRGRPVGESRNILIGSVIPAGTIAPFAGGTVPEGWLLCDGSVVSRTTYAALFAAVGTLHGQGDASTTFHLPDYRGRFLRGADDMGTGAAGRDPNAGTRTAANTGGATGATVGSVQGVATKAPNSAFSAASSGNHNHSVLVGGGNNVVYVFPQGIASTNHVSAETWAHDPTSTNGDHTHSVTGGDAETRPLNANTAYIIKV